MTISRRYEANKEEQPELSWLPFVNRTIVLRAVIVAVIVGSILTLINQFGWVAGREPPQLLQLSLVFLLPFSVVTVAQVAGVRRANIDSVGHGAPASPEGFMATLRSHGIPARAVAIGLGFGSLNAIIVFADAILRSGDISAVSVVALVQAYVLPLLFGMLSQAISYRRSRYQ